MSLTKTKTAAMKLVDSYVTSMFNNGATFSFATTDITFTKDKDEVTPTNDEVVSYMKEIFKSKVKRIPEHIKKAKLEKDGIVINDPINIANAMEKIFVGIFCHSQTDVVVGFTHFDTFDVSDLCKRVSEKAGCSGVVYYSDKEGDNGRKHVLIFTPPNSIPPFKFRDMVQNSFFSVFKDLGLYGEEEYDDEMPNYDFEF